MSNGTNAPRAVLVLSLLLTSLVLIKLARDWIREGAGLGFTLGLQYAASLVAALLLGGYVFSLERWMFLCGSVALIPAGVSGMFNAAFSRLPR